MELKLTVNKNDDHMQWWRNAALGLTVAAAILFGWSFLTTQKLESIRETRAKETAPVVDVKAQPADTKALPAKNPPDAPAQ